MSAEPLATPTTRPLTDPETTTVTAARSAVVATLRVFTGADGADGVPVWVHDASRSGGTVSAGPVPTVHVHDGGWAATARDPKGAPTSSPVALLAAVDLLAQDRSERRYAINGRAVVGWREGSLVWVRIPMPEQRVVLEQHPTPGALDHLVPAADPGAARFAWAWIDEARGLVRARLFPVTHDIEPLADPDGALALQRVQPRPLIVRQGRASALFTRPAPAGKIEIGGRVARSEPALR